MEELSIQEQKLLLRLVAQEMTQRMESIYNVWCEILEFLEEIDPEKVRELDEKYRGEIKQWHEFLGLEEDTR